MKRTVCAAILVTVTGLTADIAVADKAAEVSASIAAAEKELAAAAEAGHVWRLIDPASGGSSVDIDKLLAIAKKKQAAGELDEALRIANRVSEAAVLGQQQAKSQAQAGPSYPEN